MCKDKYVGSSNISVLTSDNTYLTSYTSAARYMEAKEKYTKESVDRLYLYPDGKNHKILIRNMDP